MSRTILVTLFVFVSAIDVAVAQSPVSGGGEEGEVRVFEADLGPAFVDISSYPPEQQARYPLFAEKCSKCHTLARPVNSSMKGEEWYAYVSRMSHKPGSGISPKVAEEVFAFLAYDSAVRARTASAVDPELVPFLEVSGELSGVRRYVASNKNIPAGRDTLRLRVQGDRRLDLSRLFASDAGQALLRWTQREPSRGDLLLRKVGSLDGAAPGPGRDTKAAGRAREAALEAVGGEADPREKVELILDWMDESLARTYRPGKGDAEAALAERRGDATEFARVFCAMAEAVGIPARTRVGLVARRTAFYFHAWAEVWIAGWRPVDPYLGQFPADITHVRLALGGGDDLAGLDAGRFPALERLRLTVVDEEKEGVAIR